MSNVEGRATAITVFSAVRWWGRFFLPILFVVVRRIPPTTRRLRRLSFIHFARWALISTLPHHGKLHHPWLYFESNFNGSWEEYIDAFSNQLTRGMWMFWGSSFGFPGALPSAPFKEYIKEHETTAAHYYSAYPEATTTMILRALAAAGHEAGPPVTAFMSMAPIRPGEQHALREYLQAMDPGPLAKLGRTHMGRFVIITDFHNDPAWGQRHEDHLRQPYLLFSASFDGGLDSYLAELCAQPEAAAIWECCVDFPRKYVAEQKAYLQAHEIPADVVFAGYAATVPEVRDALARFPPDDSEWVSKIPTVRVLAAHATRIAGDTYQRERARCPAGSLAKRDQHAEEYGTIWGRLRVRVADVPEDMRYGLFTRDGDYDVVARLSPNKGGPWPLCPPVGMGLKILGVRAGDTKINQDFLAGATTDVFFCKDAADAVALVQARAGGLPGLARYFFPSIRPARWRLLELRVLIKTLTARVEDLLAGTTYFSQGAIGCGPDLDVKVSFNTPAAPGRRFGLRRPDLAGRLRKRLANEPATMTLSLQRQGPGDDVDDLRRPWTGSWIPVGEIHWPAQDVVSGEHLSFTLDRCHPDHESRGQVAEVRKGVYARISRDRHRDNGVLEREP